MKKKQHDGDTLIYLQKTMRIMRLSLFLMIISTAMAFSATSYSQNTKLTLDLNNATVKEVIKAIEDQSEFLFFYQEQHVDLNRKVTMQVTNQEVETILNRLFAETDNIYVINDRQIVIGIAPRRELEKQMLRLKGNVKTVIGQPQQKEITGKVTDTDGLPLPGVSVIVKGTTIGTVTNADGEFSLNIPLNAETLQFSFVGMKTQEVPVDGRAAFDVVMEEETIGIEEVVAVAYGVTTRRMSTGAMQDIDSNELKDIPAAQVTQKLQGKLAGVEINQNSGKPGQGMQVRVRGSASISTASGPLYVVDGFPIVGDISNINPNEIESITVLKDAASTALYGSRAAFGVVLVTTKNAKEGQSNVSVSAYTGFQQVPQKGRPNMMNGTEWAQFKKEYYEDLGQTVPEAFQNPSQYGKGYDWYDAMLRTGTISDLHVLLSTNKDKLSNSFSVGYFAQEGVVLNSDYNRISLRNNAIYQVTDNFKLGANIAPVYNYGNDALTDGFFGGGQGMLANAMLTPPILDYRNQDGSLPVTVTTPGITAFNTPNWVRSIQDIKNRVKTQKLLSNVYAEVEPISNLVLKSSFNIDMGQTTNDFFQPSTASFHFASQPSSINASLGQNRSNYYSWLSENTATYSNKIQNHNFDLLAGYTVQKYRSDVTNVSGSNFTDDRVKIINAALTKDNPWMDIQEWSLISYLARVNYNYNQKYMFSFSIRRDGSSRFGTNNKWGNFPAVSAAWVVSDEPFMPNLKALSFLKIRGSYGSVGNNNIGNYTHYATVSSAVNSVFGSTIASGTAVTSLGNGDLGWEITKELDLGADLRFVDGRISFSYDFYNKKTSNLLLSFPVAQESGFSSLQANVGEIKFWGHEFSLNTRNLVGELKWETDFNISFSDNKVLKLSGLTDAIYHYEARASTITKVGERVGQFYGFIQEGVYVDQEDFDNSPKSVNSEVGTIKFKDVNKDGVITFGDTDGDKTIIGNPFPKFTFGMTNNFSYNRFDLSVVATGSYGNDIASVVESGTANLDGVFNVLKEVKNRWRSPSNPGDRKYGKTTGSTADDRDLLHSRFIQDGSYLTIKNITLGYDFPVNNWAIVKSIRLYGSIQQAFVFTKYKGANPEIGTDANGNSPSALAQGFDFSAYPVPRTVSFGINVSLK